MMKECNKKACIISFVAVFAFVFGYDMLVHGQLLKADYEATANLWRTETEMQALGHWCIIYHVLLALALTCLFKKVYKGSVACCPEAAGSCCPIKTGGLCFGVAVGLLIGTLSAASYVWLPIPGDLAVKWFFAGLFQGIGAGVVLGIVCGKCSTKSCDTKAPDTTGEGDA